MTDCRPDALCEDCLAGGMDSPEFFDPPLNRILWLGRAGNMGLQPLTPDIARLARGAMASFWSRADGSSPAVTIHDVVAAGASLPELHVTYIYSN